VLREADGGLACGRCGGRYPVFAGIPCLVEDPNLWWTIWLRRLDAYSNGVEMRVASLEREAEEVPQLLPRTRERLLRVAAGFSEQLAAVAALFEPLQAGADAVASMAVPSRPEQGREAAILECYEHVFRDWVWGGPECEAALGFVAPLVPEGVGRIAVYGAGAGRLAVDLHQSRTPGKTYALDINPLPFLIASRLLAGEPLTLPEFPVDPNSADTVVVERPLTRPFVVRDGFSFLFADALRPPFAPASVDVVVTSWFIDVARSDLRQTAAAINRVLRPAGIWVNLGPLRFNADLSRSYTIEEVLELVGLAGFELESHDRQDLPYFDSPVSGSRRTDTVFRFAARKHAEAGPVDVRDPLPPWVANPMLPIPITPALVQLGRTTMFTTGVLSMIDGTRSIVELSRELEKAWGVDAARLQDELRAFLAQLPVG
jgi:hypothetical protein